MDGPVCDPRVRPRGRPHRGGPTHGVPWPLAAGLLCALGGGLTCGGERFATRAVYLVSGDVSVDATLARARRAADDGDWDGATAHLVEIETRHPDDPLALAARVLRARVALARGDVDGAARTVIYVPPGRDPALDMQRDLVLGLVAARRHDTARGTALLRPLSRRLIDRAQTAEVDCGMASLESANGSVGASHALARLAEIESLAEDGVLWLPTGLDCDRPDQRAAAFAGLVGHVADPAALAAVLDALPARSPRRTAVARRLRDVADARHEISRWRRWLADLPAGEATLMPVAGPAGPVVLRVGVLAPVSGLRASVGVSVVREVQLALESDQVTEVLVEDEGTTAASVTAAYQRLAAAGVDAVVGPTQEELARALVASLGGTEVGAVGPGNRPAVYLIAPYADAVESAWVHRAGPSLVSRTTKIVNVARPGPVVLVTPEGAGDGEFVTRLRGTFSLAGLGVREGDGGGTALRRVVVGPLASEARRAMASQAAMTPGRWVFDGRSGLPGTPGVWVGLRPGRDAEQHLVRYCALVGEPPGELGMLAYDAAQTILARVRGGDRENVLDPTWEVTVTGVSAAGSTVLAVTRHCPDGTGADHGDAGVSARGLPTGAAGTPADHRPGRE